MSQTLERRVKVLEMKVAKLTGRPARQARKKDWRRTIGIFENDKDFEGAVRFGRAYREAQTHAKEVARS